MDIQYDTPPEISLPQETERGRRWSAERSPSRRSRSQSNSRHRSPVPHRENGVIYSSAARHGRDSSAEARREDRPSRRHSRNQSPRSIPSDRADDDPRNHPSGRRHSPLDGVQVILRNDYSQPGPEASNSAVPAENQDNNLSVQPHFPGNEKGKSQATENTVQQFVPATTVQNLSAPPRGDSAAALAVGQADMTHLIDGTGDDCADKVRDGSSANPQPSRKRSAGLSVHVHPRNRTLSESIQAYLSRPAALQHTTKKPSVPGDERPTRASNPGPTSRPATGTRPSLLLRLTDGPTSPDMGKLPSPGRTANGDLSTPNNTTTEQQRHNCRSQSCVSLLNCCSSTVADHAEAITRCGGRVDDGATRSHRFLPSTDDEASGVHSSSNPIPGKLGFPPIPSVTPLIRNANDVTLSHALVLEGPLVDGRPKSVPTRHGESPGKARRFHAEMGAARGTGDQARPGDGKFANDDALNLRSDLLGRWTLLGGAAATASLDAHKHNVRGDTNKDTWPSVEISTDPNVAGPSFFHGDKKAACEVGSGGFGDDAPKDESTFGSGSGSSSVSTSTPMQMSGSTSTSADADADASELETRLRMRARLRVRLAAMKGTGSVVSSLGSVSVSVASSGSDSGSGLGMDSGLGLGLGLCSGPGRQDDARVWDPSVGLTISGDRGECGDGDGDGDGPNRDHNGHGGIRDKDKNEDKNKVALKTDRDKEQLRETALRGMLMLRERVPVVQRG